MARSIHCSVIFLAFFLCVTTLTAEASRKKPVFKPASAEDVFFKGGQTLDINRHWGEIIDVVGGTTNVPVVQSSKYNPTRIAGMIKNLAKLHPGKLIATGVGMYLIDQLPGASFDPVTGELVRSSESVMPIGGGSTDYAWYPVNYPDMLAGSFTAACQAFLSNKPGSVISTQTINSQSGGGRCSYWSSLNILSYVDIARRGSQCPAGGVYKPVQGHCVGTTKVPFSNSDFDQLVPPYIDLDPSQWSEIGPELLTNFPASFDGPDDQTFTGPSQIVGTPTITTSTDQSTGQVTVTESVPSTQLDYGVDPLSITTTTTTTTTTYQNGVVTNTTIVTEGAPSTDVITPVSESPTDCEFMPTVCAFIDWVKTPFIEPDPDLPGLVDDDYSREFNISGQAVCPAPAEFEILSTPVRFEYDLICEYAIVSKPAVILICLITAIFISLGYRSGSSN